MPSPEHATLVAEKLVKDLGITTLPIDPFAIAHDHGIQVKGKPSDVAGVSGMLVHHHGNFGIFYATHIKSRGFQRFSVAHELGHYFLPNHPDAVFGPDGVHESRAGFCSDDPYEREADHFAAGLLMPRFLVRKQLLKFAEGLNGVEALSNICDTSLPATAIRYAQVTDALAATIQSTGNRIDWCFKSDALKALKGLDWIRKNQPLPKNCATYRFNKENNNIQSAERLEDNGNLQDWFNGPYDVEIIEEVKGLGSYEKTLTVLTTEDFDPEEQEENDELEESWTPRFRR